MTLESTAAPGALTFRDLPSDLDTPCVVVDLARVEANAARLQAELDDRGIALRPHAKTHKSVRIAKLQIAAGARGLTVGTLGEAEVFAAAGITDLFIAYPIRADGPKESRLVDLVDELTVVHPGGQVETWPVDARGRSG